MVNVHATRSRSICLQGALFTLTYWDQTQLDDGRRRAGIQQEKMSGQPEELDEEDLSEPMVFLEGSFHRAVSQPDQQHARLLSAWLPACNIEPNVLISVYG